LNKPSDDLLTEVMSYVCGYISPRYVDKLSLIQSHIQEYVSIPNVYYPIHNECSLVAMSLVLDPQSYDH